MFRVVKADAVSVQLDTSSCVFYDISSLFCQREKSFLTMWVRRVICRRQTNFGHVRQLVDSLPYKEEVRGSSPFVPTISIADLGMRIVD